MELWNFYSKIKFEVLYLTQFSIFLEKKGIFGIYCLLQHCKHWDWYFSIPQEKKWLTILYFESFSTFFYLVVQIEGVKVGALKATCSKRVKATTNIQTHFAFFNVPTMYISRGGCFLVTHSDSTSRIRN